MTNPKIEIQHNMFIELFPQDYFQEYLINSIIIRKIDIKRVYKENTRKLRKDRNTIYTIVFELYSGELIIEDYDEIIYLDDKILYPDKYRNERFNNIKNQLEENK